MEQKIEQLNNQVQAMSEQISDSQKDAEKMQQQFNAEHTSLGQTKLELDSARERIAQIEVEKRDLKAQLTQTKQRIKEFVSSFPDAGNTAQNSIDPEDCLQ